MKTRAILAVTVFAMTVFATFASANPSVSSFTIAENTEGAPPVSVRTGEENSAKPKHVMKPGWGGWGGPMNMFLFPSSDLFSPTTDALGIDSFPGMMYMIGGMGMGQLGPHFRIGGGGAGGTLYADGNVLGADRSALIAMGYGGLVLYGMYPLGEKFDIYGKALIGAGGLSVSVKGDDLPDGLEESVGFFTAQPAIGIAYHPVRWMSIELEAAYFGMLLEDVSIEGQTMVEDGFVGGPMAQLNILFGWTNKAK